MRLSVLSIGVGLLLSSGFVTANEACDNANTQAELTQCTAQGYQVADDELNEAYRVLVSKLDNNSASLEKLREAQRAWINFRDAECAFESSAVEGGSAQPMVRNGCLTAQTKARTERLQEHASCEEGDLSCPW
ncbi:lysozyme inhibitor LprI family protein [Halovibrio sp. HP20-50]|uniref:lysozyme inhibitor LprI family protein n=1 Tax=Halovibrio sp. HP20-59 TaxID=3080275 RepID=UPI00294AD536|nr:lysozyme inhibitor LprI family protein [Halovibrio sp. HP20-59]MEA2120005.1 lysozyme inhibitor LprI family protein [Halovibrio sp. HP20-59]